MGEFRPVYRTVRSGIPVVWLPWTGGDYSLGFVVRAGRADERLDIAGVAHLVEHLLLPAEAGELQRAGGVVDSTLTTLWYKAERPEDCLAFARGVADRARALPEERFEREKRILRAEGEAGWHPINYALTLRFGARRHGLMGFPQLGLPWLGLDETQEWARRHVNRSNLVIWMTWEPPSDLDLDFPEGERFLAPEPQPLDYLSFPAIAAGPDDYLLFQFLRERSTASSVAVDLLQERLLASLRFEHGLGYQVGLSDETRTGLTTISTLVSDPNTADASSAIEASLRVFEKTAEHGAANDEIDEIVRRREAWTTETGASPSRLIRHALGELDPASEFDEQLWLDEMRSLQPAQIADAVRSMLPTALMVAPPSVTHPAGFTSLALSSPVRAEGKRFAFKHFPARTRRSRKRKVGTFLSRSLLTTVWLNGSHATVDLSSAELMVAPDEEKRIVWGPDGTCLEIEQRAFEDGAELIASIDRLVPPERVRADPELVLRQKSIESVLDWYPPRKSRILTLAYVTCLIIFTVATGGAGLILIALLIAASAKRTERRLASRACLAGIVAGNVRADEEVSHVVEARLRGRDGGHGLLVLTNRNLLFMSRRAVRAEIEISDITSARNGLITSAVAVRTGGHRLCFDGALPRRQRRALVRELRVGRQRATDRPRWLESVGVTGSEQEKAIETRPTGIGELSLTGDLSRR